jgi:hypothetical protein
LSYILTIMRDIFKDGSRMNKSKRQNNPIFP